MRDLLRITDTLEPQRVVLIGDIKQLDAVNAGQPFSQLQHAGMQTAVMDQIMRQRDDNLKAAVVEALSGELAAALARLDIIEAGRSDLAQTAATRWLMLPPEIRDETGLMAPTHALREEINSTIRQELARDGVIHGEAAEINQMVSLRLTAAERELAASYHEGHTILFGTDISRAGIEAGDALIVTGNKDELVHVENKDGDIVALDPSGGMAERIEVYETAPMELRAGDAIRWTRNDKELDLVTRTRQRSPPSVTGWYTCRARTAARCICPGITLPCNTVIMRSTPRFTPFRADSGPGHCCAGFSP